MEINISGRNVSVSDRFRDFVNQKSDRIPHIDRSMEKLVIKLSRHIDRNGHESDCHIELILKGHGQTLRVECEAKDKYSAFDVAIDKLMQRVRRAKDRRIVHHGGAHRMTGLSEATSLDRLLPEASGS